MSEITRREAIKLTAAAAATALVEVVVSGGALAHAADPDEKKLVGTWKGPWTLELDSNGDARYQGTFSDRRGRWKRLPGNRLEVRWEDAKIEPLQEWRYEIKGDRLLLFPRDVEATYAYELARVK